MKEYDITTDMCDGVDMSSSGDKKVVATVDVFTSGPSKLDFTIKVETEAIKYDPTIDQHPSADLTSKGNTSTNSNKDTSTGTHTNTTSPETGDNMPNIFVMVVAFVVAAGVVVVMLNRKYQFFVK